MAESRVIITADAEQARREIERFRDSASGSMGQVGALSGKLGDTLKSLGFAALAAGAIKLSDAYDQMTARLKMATATTTQLMVAQRELMAISVRQRSGLDATVDLYAKTSAATADMGVSQKNLLKFTEGVSAALRINGTTAEAAAGALNQLGQAMGGSTIQAEEYNSILDGARPLLQAVANNIGAAGGSVAKLTALVKAGKVGTAEFFEAAVKGSDELIAAGDKIPLTFSQALGVAKDRLMMFVGGVNQSTGAVSGMSQGIVAASEAIVFLSAHLDVVVGVVGTLVAARLGSWALTAATNLYGIVVASRAAAAATLVTAQAEVTATATASSLAAAKVIQARATLAGMAADADKTIAILILNAAEQKAAAAASAHTLAQMAQTAALRATSVAAGVARSALALVGGPIGAIVTVLGLAATAWYAFGKSASDSSQEAAGAAELTSDEIVANLEKQTAKLRERIALAKLGQVEIAKMESPEAQGIAKMGARIANMRANYSSLTGVQQIALIELTEQFNKASAAMTRTVSATTDMAGVKTLQTTGEWMKKYATNAEKLKEKLDEVRKSYADGVIPAELEKRIRESFADKDAAGALKKEADAYTNLSVAIGTKIKETTLEMSGLSNLNEAQKLQIALDEQIAAGKLTLAPKHKAAYEQQIKDLAVNLEVIESRKRAQAGAEAMGKVEDAYQEQVKRRLATTVDEAEKNEELVRTFGMTKAAISQLELSRLEEQLAQRASTGLTMDEIDALEKLIAAKKRSAVSTITLEGLEADKAATAAKLADSKKMWESIDQTAQDTLVSIGNSSISAIDRVWGSLKNGLFAWLYQATLKKWIINIGASVSGGGAAGLASAGDLGLTGGSAGGGVGGIASLAQSAKTAYTIATQGFAGITAGLGSGVVSLGTLFGSTAVEAFGAGLGSTGLVGAADAAGLYAASGGVGSAGAVTAGAYAGAAVTAAAGIAAGVLGGRMISGQYGSNSTVNAGTGIGAIAGAVMGGPIGAAIGGAIGGVVGGLANRAFGMGDKKYGETGITGTLSGTGFSGTEYAKWTQKGGWLRSDKSDTDRKAVDTTTSNAFVETYAAIRNVSATLANTLGIDTSSLATRAQALNINLTGLTTEADRLGAVTKFFEGVGNTIAVELVPNLAQFQVQGESLSTTLQRVSQDYASIDAALQLLGRNSQQAFGTVGTASIAAREALIKMAGGLDALTGGTQFFAENFLTVEQQMAPVIENVNKSLAALGKTSVTTTKQYADAVLDLTKSGALATESGQQLYLQLLALAPAFKSVTDYNEKLNKSLEEVAEKTAAAAKAAADGAIAAAKAAEEAAAAVAAGLLSAVDAAGAIVQTVVNREKTALAKANEIAAKAMQIRIDNETAALAKHKSLRDALKSSLDQMNVSGTMEDMGRATAQAQIAAVLASVKAGGALPDADTLKDALSSVTKDASDKFATYDDYLVDFYRTQNDIAALGKLTDFSLSVEQKTLDLLQAQKDASQVAYEAEVARLDGILETARSQIDVLKGIDTTSLSILQAIAGLASAMAAAQANSSVGALAGINNAYQAALGRAPEKAGMDYWGGLANSGTSIGDIVSGIKNSPEAQAQALYKSVMGRAGDAAGIDYWTNVLAGGSSIDQVRAAMMGSAEYQKLHSFDVGTNYLPSDMLAQVHEGERIIPAADNRELMARLSSPTSNNDALAAEVRELRRENREMRAMMESHLYAIAKNTLNAADSLEGAANGDMPLTTKKVEETA